MPQVPIDQIEIEMKRVRGAQSRHSIGAIRAIRAYSAVVPLALPLLLISTGSRQRELPPTSPVPAIDYRILDLGEPLPSHAVHIRIAPGDTLDSLLRSGGLTGAESARLIPRLAASIDPRRLKPGEIVRFEYDDERRVQKIDTKVIGWGRVEATRAANGFEVHATRFDITTENVAMSGVVESSLFEAVCSDGEDPRLVQHLIDVFQWDIDFFRLRRGDSFSLVVEKRFAGPDMIGYGPVLAARFEHNGHSYEAFRYEGDGRSGYYSRDGAPLRKQFLRAPLKYSRITSGFSARRFHPVLQRFKAHHGVDYGAPKGTPVMATSDGTVTFAGYDAGEGNFVRLRHNSRLQTYYLHLSRFAAGIRKGRSVRQGEIIGYVGSTGLATGPHLDYRVSENGRWLNPLKLKSVTADPLHGRALKSFRSLVSLYLPRLERDIQRLAKRSEDVDPSSP